MDHGFVLAARLGLDPFFEVSPPSAEPDPPLPPSSPPSAGWIRDALAAVARHQRSGESSRVWPLLRELEPLVPRLAGDDPAGAGRVIGALATQALLEGDWEAFLARARGAAEAFNRAGDAEAARVERASLGGGYRMLGAWEEAAAELTAASVDAEWPSGVRGRASFNLARVGAARGDALAGGLVSPALGAFHRLGERGWEGATKAWYAGHTASTDGWRLAAEAARDAQKLLAGSRAGRVYAGAALAAALLAEGRIRRALAAAERAHRGLAAGGRPREGGLAVLLVLGDTRRAAGDGAGAAAAYADARRWVLADASTLRDPRLRQRFLAGIPEHRRALEPPR